MNLDKILAALDKLLEKNPAIMEKIHEHMKWKMNKVGKDGIIECPECGAEINLKSPDLEMDEECEDEWEMQDKMMATDAIDNLEVD